MRRPNGRLRQLGIIFAVTATAAVSACSSSAVEPELDQEEPATWVIVSGDVTADVVAFLGPAPGGKSRVAATRGDRTILRAREADLELLAGFFHDRFQRCGGFTAHA